MALHICSAGAISTMPSCASNASGQLLCVEQLWFLTLVMWPLRVTVDSCRYVMIKFVLMPSMILSSIGWCISAFRIAHIVGDPSDCL